MKPCERNDPMTFPAVIYVKQNDAIHQYFSVATHSARLVGDEPTEIATYRLVETKRWKRVVVRDPRDLAESGATARAPGAIKRPSGTSSRGRARPCT